MAPARPSTLALPLLIILLLLNLALAARPRLAAQDDAVFLPGPGLAPRWYMEVHARALPVLPGIADLKRQDNDDSVYQCPAGQHNCLDIGAASSCCTNEQYCFRDSSWNPKCCHLGVDCPDSLCPETSLFCNTTSSTLVPVTTAPEPATTTAFIESLTTLEACCNRPCSSSSFLCQDAFGGQCCEYGFKCASGNSCILDATPSSSVSTIVTPVPSGCTTNQITCDATLGGGCCDIGSLCTYQSVAPATSTPVCAPNITVSSSSSSGLSSQAKAGIGAGLAVGAALVIGGLTWFCLHRRRTRRTTSGAPGAVDGGGGGAAAGTRDDGDAGRNLMSPQPAMSETTAHHVSYRRDYFGPDAIAGPYTDQEGAHSGGVDSPPLPSDTTGRYFTPAGEAFWSPDDIGRPFITEMDSRVAESESLVAQYAPAPEQDATRYELPANPPLGDMSAEEAGSWRDSQVVSPIMGLEDGTRRTNE
ncbi:hypothetical protein F5Y15DRAFT_354393 [Xylariaceae sp. FL0016]|nr:hypothetical protein F5Y15DRAFT_354393 [Xylariaceae sp. FL0016]